jgi:hypothetical protein
MEIAKAVVLAGACSGSDDLSERGLRRASARAVANRPVLFHHLDAVAERASARRPS